MEHNTPHWDRQPPYDRLVIPQWESGPVTGIVDTVDLKVILEEHHPAPGFSEWALTLEMDRPVRFQIDVLLPFCRNACVTLNGQHLIGWFAEALPDPDVFSMPQGCVSCGGAPDVSTLCPGEYQQLNFRWMPNDRLVVHILH